MAYVLKLGFLDNLRQDSLITIIIIIRPIFFFLSIKKSEDKFDKTCKIFVVVFS